MSEDSTCRPGDGETCILGHTPYRATAASNDETWEEADAVALFSAPRARTALRLDAGAVPVASYRLAGWRDPCLARADYAALNRLAAAARLTTAPGSQRRREIDRAHAEVRASLDERESEWLIYGLAVNGQMELELWNDRFPVSVAAFRRGLGGCRCPKYSTAEALGEPDGDGPC